MDNKCPKCNGTLSIAKSHIKFEGDNSPDTETKAYNVLDMICTNPRCPNYTSDLSNPIVIETLRQPMN